MYQFIPRRSGNVQLFMACLLVFTLLITPLASLAASRKTYVSFKESPSQNEPAKSAVSTAANSSVSNASVVNPVLVPVITATKTDALFTDVDNDTVADPGDTLEYTVTIQNTGADPASAVEFTDTIDAHTTLVPGSVNTSPIAFDDPNYTATGNVRITIGAASGVLTNDIDPDTGTSAGLTASAGVTSVNGGNVTMSADGSFVYNPPAGYTGTDTFTYTVTDSSGATGTGTVTFTITGVIWFVNAAAGGGGDGRLTTPFNCLVGAGCYFPAAADEAGDNIFLYSGSYTGGLTLLASQRLIGAGATTSLSTITGLTPPTGSDPLPALNGTPSTVTITTTVAATDAVTLGSGNTLRGFTIGNTTDSDIAGTSFGVLNISEVNLNGTGRALDLNTGSFASGSSLVGITVDSSTGQGMLMQSVSGPNALTIGSTTITSSTTQGILITQSTVPISFGNTSIGNNTVATDPTIGLSLQNNSAGTRTFGTLSIQNTTQQGFVHAIGGGATTVGNTTITNPGLAGIDIQDSTTAISFANVSVTSSGGTGVFIDDSSGSVTFADLDITPDGGQRGLHITDQTVGTITTTSGSISTTTGTGVEITGGTPPLAMVLTLVSVSGAPSGVVIQGNSGSFSVIGDNTNARNGSGGVMTNTTDDGIRLTNANNITLKSINLNSPGDTLQVNIADNEGTLGEHGVEANGGSNIILSGVLIDSPAGSGMIALNLTGTNRINNNSLVTNIDNPATHGLFIKNGSGFNMTLFEVNDTDFTNSSSGASTLNATNEGTANMTVEIRNGCIFEALDSQAVTIAGGANLGTTGTLTSLVTGNTFRNAVPINAGGTNVSSENNVAALVSNGAIHNATISSNLLENIAEDGRVANTSIIRTQNSGGQLTAVVQNNTIQNINYDTGAGGRHVIGHVFEPAAFNAASFSDLRIQGNTATNITYTATNREFVFIDYRQFSSSGDIKILDNNWNMPTAAATSESIELRFRQSTAGQVVNVQVNNNGNGTGAIHNASTRFLNLDSEEAANVNATITNNKFTNSNGAPGPAIDVQAEEDAAITGTGATLCANISGNNLAAAGNSITVNEEPPAQSVTVTQASQAALSAANGGAAVTVVGPVGFGGPVCALPTNASLRVPNSGWAREAVATVVAEKDYASAVRAFTRRDSAPATAPVISAAQNSSNAIRRHLHHAVSKVKRIPSELRTNAAAMMTMLSGETVTVEGTGSGFTLPAGKTITIKFRVTVDNPPNLPPAQLNPARVINQGTVSGTNFSSVLTDDTAVPGLANPTETLIDLFDSQTSVITSDATIVEGDSVTFTATVTPVSSGPTPVTGTVDFFDGALPGGTLIVGCDDRPLSGDPATATCTTTALTAAGSPHTITARYNADGGNYDQSTGTVSQTVILVPDLTIDKAHVGTFFQGQTGAQYTITVTNNGGGAMPAGETITVTDTLPAGLTVTAITGTNWTCTATPIVGGGAPFTCTRSGANSALAPAASYPVITLTVDVATTAPTGNPALSNSVTVTQGAGGEVIINNNSDSDPTAINAGVDLTIDKSHTDIFTQGDTGRTYTITVTNSGGTPTSGTVTVTDTLPTGLTATAFTGTNWTCAALPALSCSRSDVLAAGNSYPEAITLTVDVASNAPPSVDNTATVSGGGDIVPGNNSDTDQTSIAQLCSTPPAGMVAWWTGDDTTRDIAGGNDGALNGNAGYAAGKVLNGFNLDGTGDFVQAPDSNSLDLTTSITIDAWINPTNANTSARLVDKITPGNTDGYLFDLNAGKLRFITGTATAESLGIIPAGTLTHVAVTYDGVNIKFYINGVLDSTTADTGAIPVNTLPLRIGADQSGAFAFQGVIDEVEIFSTALLVADILAIHDAGPGGKCKPSDLTISKTHTDPFQQGSTGNDYTITVHNDGPGDTSGTTTVTDTLPAGLTATAMGGTGWTCAPTAPPNTFPVAGPTTLECTSTDVVASADFPVITLTVDVGANAASVTNNVSVSGGGEMDTSDDTDSDLTNLNANSDLEIISKTDAADPVNAGENITYAISFINNGPSDATAVTVTDTVPTGTTLVSATVTLSSSPGWSRTDSLVLGSTGNVVFSNASVPAGATATFTMVVKVNSNVTTQISNTATAASTTSDPNGANNSKTQTTDTTATADITLGSKDDAPDPVVVGTNLTYTINFINNGPSDAVTVTVSDPLPAGTTLVSATTGDAGWSRTDAVAVGANGTIIFSNASVPAGATATFTIVVAVDSGLADGTLLTNTATAASSTDTSPGNNSATATTTVATTLGLIVNTTGDESDANLGDRICDVDLGTGGNQCTLRAAIEETNAAATADTIGFDPALNGSTITLINALDPIGGNVVITGPGAGLLTVQRSLAGGTPDFRIFAINSGNTVTISGLTLTNGKATDGAAGGGVGLFGESGGGIRNLGTLTLTDITITNSRAGRGGDGFSVPGLGGDGGGIYSDGTLTMTDCVVSGNFGGRGGDGGSGGGGTGGGGGGIFLFNGSATLRNVDLLNNAAGDSGTGINSGGGSGGGLFVRAVASADLTNCTVSGNTTGSGTNGDGFGGGIFNNGLLTITSSTLSGNTSGGPGGGIINQGTGNLTMVNSTVSGNTGTIGHGIFNDSGTSLVLSSCTITNNSPSTNDSVGVFTAGGSAQVVNTIIAGNGGTGGSDVNGPFTSQGNNLIGRSDGSTGFTHGVNGDKVGTVASPIDALLGPLANNGGPTETHALLSGSPALDAGNNATLPADTQDLDGDTNTAEQIPFDQRGFERIVDGPDGDATATVDIGAFEAQVFVENIADRAINEDGSDSFSFSVGGSVAITSVTATSSNTVLVPNNVANLDVTGAGGTRTLTINPVANEFGSTIITVTVNSASGSMSDTFTLTVNPVADTPSVTNGSTSEDTLTPLGQLVISRNAVDGAEVTHFKITAITNGTLFQNDGVTAIADGAFITFAQGNAGLRFLPALNSTASGSFTVQAATGNLDAALGGGTATATITVTDVNDPPTLDPITPNPLNILEDAGLQNVNLSGISAGGGESQTLVVTATSNNTALIPNPTVTYTSPNATGSISFTPVTNANGTADITVTVDDNSGGTETISRTFTVNVTAVNDVPSFTKGPNQIVNEDAGAQSVPGWATAISAGPPNESGQTLTFLVATSNDPLFSALPAVSATGTLTYTPAANANGVATIFIAVQDNGNDNDDVSPVQQFTITVNAVNDGPVNTVPGAQSVAENNSLTFSAGNGNQISIADIDAGASSVSVTLTAANGTVTLNGTTGLSFTVGDGTADATMTFTGTIANINARLNGLVFTPTAGFSGAASLQIVTNDQGNTGSGGALSDTDTVNITVNDGGTLQFSSATYSVNEADGTATITVTRTGGSAGTTTVDYATSNGSATLADLDYTTSSGTLTFGDGVTSQTFTVPINNDPTNEPDETVNLTLSNVTGSGALGTPATAVLTIVDNDPGGTIQFSSATYSVSENGGNATITITRTGGSAGTATVLFQTSNGTAGSGDYTTVSQTVTFVDGDTSETVDVPITNDSVDEPDETVNLTLSNAGGTGTLGTPATAVLTIQNDDDTTFSFAVNSYSVGEAGPSVIITVNRSGDVSGAATVDYSTNDFMAALCSTANGNASAKCDYATTGGRLRFAASQTSRTIELSIVDDVYVEGDETLSMTLSDPVGGALGSPSTTVITIQDNDTDPNAANPFPQNPFFVRQQYLDFLLREPDNAGFTDWLNVLNNCQPNQGFLGSDPACDRVHVSSGFFRSTEFGERGYWVYRFFEASLGRRPQFAEFMPEMKRLSGLKPQADLDQDEADFIAEFMQLPEFTAEYSGLTNAANAAQFIAALEQNSGLTLPATVPPTQPGQPTQYGRQELIDLMANGTLTPAQTLRAFVEQKVVWDAYFFKAFVAMQYFGYLRRDPEPAGYDDWLDVLTNGRPAQGIPPGDFRHLVFGFVYSVEYRERFGQP